MIKYLICVASIVAGTIVAGAVVTEKTYPVKHTIQQWGQIQAGNANIQRLARYSNLSPEVRFYIDSVIEAHNDDITRQVNDSISKEPDANKLNLH